MSALDYWNDELEHLAPSTRKNYRISFNMFLEYMGLTAEELYQMHKQALTSDDRREHRKVIREVRKCMDKMIKEGSERAKGGYKPGTAQIVGHAVSSFMRANDLPFKLERRDKPKAHHVGRVIIKTEQIKRFYDLVNHPYRERNRALTMLLKDSGLRVSDVSRLNVEDYLSARLVKNNKDEPFKVFAPFTTQKTGEIAYIHLGPEAVRDVDVYIGPRKSGPLFLNRDGERLSSEGISQIFNRLSKKLEHGDRISAHSFRKFNKTRLESVMSESWIKKLQGKATDPYTQPEQTGALTDAYVDGYDQLRVFVESARPEDVEALRSEVTELRARVREMEPLHETWKRMVKARERRRREA